MLNCTQYCRLCLKEDKWGTPVHIFEDNPFDESLDEVINILSGIRILKDDGLPDVICCKCLGIITIFMDFRVKVIKNYKFLKSVLKIPETSDNAPVVNNKCKRVSDDTPTSTPSVNYRRPGPKSSKTKPSKTMSSTIIGPELETKTSTIVGSDLSPSITPTPSFSSEKTEIEPSTDRIWNPTPSENIIFSDATTTQSHKSSNQGNISDSSGSTVLLDKYRNANSVTPNCDTNSMELDRQRTALEETLAFINGVNLDGLQPEKSKAKRGRGRPPRISLICEHCNRPFLKSTDYKNHKLLHKRLGAKIYLCKYCGMAYGSDYEVTLHVKFYHQFSSVEVLKQKELEQKTLLTLLSPTPALNTAASSSNNLDLIESADPPPTTTNKRKRPTKQATASKKVKSSAKTSMVIVADVHTPMQEEQTNEPDSSVTVAEIHRPNQQPTGTLEGSEPSTGTLTSQSKQPANDSTFIINKTILKQTSSTTFKLLKSNYKNGSDSTTSATPVESAKDNSPTKLCENSSVSRPTVIDEHLSTKQSNVKMNDRSTSIDDNTVIVSSSSSEEEMSGSISTKSVTSDEDIRMRQDEKIDKPAVNFNVPSVLVTPVKSTQPVVEVAKCDPSLKEAKVCNICRTFKSTSMREIFMHKKKCK